VRAYVGDAEPLFRSSTMTLAARAAQRGLDVRAEVVPGNHMSHVAEAIHRSIDFLQTRLVEP